MISPYTRLALEIVVQWLGCGPPEGDSVYRVPDPHTTLNKTGCSSTLKLQSLALNYSRVNFEVIESFFVTTQR